MSPLFPLLALLARGDAHGYELKRIIAVEFAPHWEIDFAQLYRSLAKLEAQGFVRVHAQKGAGGPKRQVYALTARGRRALERWLQEPATQPDEFWVKTRLAEGVASDAQMPLLIAGSDDLLLAWLARAVGATSRVMGSTRGLERLAEQQSDLAGAHLREPEAREYNVSFVQHLIPEQDILVVNLAIRDFGLMVAHDNPKKIRGVRDVAKQDVRLLNRSYGAGARVWLHQQLRAARVDPTTLPGWTHIAPTYDALTRAIERDKADVGPGVRAATEARGLDFIALGQERFDLILSRTLYESARGRQLRETLHSTKFRAYASTLPGYDISQSGQVIAEIKYGTRR